MKNKKNTISVWKGDIILGEPISLQHFFEQEIIELFGIDFEQFDNKIIELYEKKIYAESSFPYDVVKSWERSFENWIENNHELDFNELEKKQLRAKYFAIYDEINPYPELLEFDISDFYKA